MKMALRIRFALILLVACYNLLSGIIADTDQETCFLADGTCEAVDSKSKEPHSNGKTDDDGTDNRNSPLLLRVECVDNEEDCAHWASRGECTINPAYMHPNCMKSCQLCSEDKYVFPVFLFMYYYYFFLNRLPLLTIDNRYSSSLTINFLVSVIYTFGFTITVAILL